MPSSQSVEVTHNATFTTMVIDAGSAYFTYQWKHNGTIISGEAGDTLSITGVMENDTGHYECMVTNQFGYTNVSNVVVLTVTSKLANTTVIITVCYYLKCRKITCYHSTTNQHKN